MFGRNKQVLKGMVLASALLGMVACGDGNNNGGGGGSGDIDVGTGTGNASVDTQTTVSATQANTQTGVTQAVAASGSSLKFTTINESTACSGGGTFVVSGDVTPGSPTASYDLDFDFEGCDLYDGSVSVTGEYGVDADSFLYNYSINGDVGGNGCLVTFDNFSISIDIGTGFPLSGSIGLDGSVTGDCGSAGSTSCSYDAIEINLGTGSVTGTPSCS